MATVTQSTTTATSRTRAAQLPATMKAVVQHGYGSPDVLVLEDIERPTIGERDVLVRVRAAGVSYPDHVFVRGVPYLVRLLAGLRRPRHPVRGSEIAGTVSAVGAKVIDLQPGDAVFGWCGGSAEGGGFAEYARVPRPLIVKKPDSLTFEQAASLPLSGVTALQAVRDWAKVQPGQTVLVNGASGGVGSFAVQIARALGASVTGVCSTRNVDLVQSIGAATVIDYTQQDFTRGPERFDVMLDFPHYASHTLAQCLRALQPRGTLVPASNTRNRWIGGFSRVLPARVLAPFVTQRITAPEMAPNQADLIGLAELVTSGKLTPVIDRTYPLAEVREAIAYFETGRVHGKVVISI